MIDNYGKILYVDDEYANRIMFQLTYRGELDIILAESGDQGLDIMKQEDIAVVISDMRMPGMDGLEFITEARKDYPNLHYCLLTGFTVTPEIEKALEDQVIEKYFKKPFDRELILNYIKSISS